MEKLVIGLPDLVIEKIVGSHSLTVVAGYTGVIRCPHCGGRHLRVKNIFQSPIKNFLLRGRASQLQIVCHKDLCRDCGRYFNTRLPGVRLWSRSAELLKKNVSRAYSKGYSCKDIAIEHNIGLSGVERFYHHLARHKASHWQDRECPRVLGIDEHRFTRKQGFLTTFCDLEKRRVIDIAKGRSAGELGEFLLRLMRLLLMRRDWMTIQQQERVSDYLSVKPAITVLYGIYARSWRPVANQRAQRSRLPQVCVGFA